jgi:hypothetical protein
MQQWRCSVPWDLWHGGHENQGIGNIICPMWQEFAMHDERTEQWQQWWLQCGCLVLCFAGVYPSPRINSWGPWSSAFLGKLPRALLIFCLLSFLSHIDSRWCSCWEELLLGTLASRQINHAFPSNSDMPSEVCISICLYICLLSSAGTS